MLLEKRPQSGESSSSSAPRFISVNTLKYSAGGIPWSRPREFFGNPSPPLSVTVRPSGTFGWSSPALFGIYSSTLGNRFHRQVGKKEMHITVVGLGKIGLPLAVQYARKGHTVRGVDTNEAVVRLVNQGIEPFPGEEDLAGYLIEEVSSGRLNASSDYSEAVPFSDAIVVVVPLYVNEDNEPDFGWLDSATESIGRHITRQTLVCFETTLPVGTCRSRWAPALERISGLRQGEDFHVVFSPERVLTGRVFRDLRKYPKIVGGLSPIGESLAIQFYESVLDFDDRPDLSRPNGVWSVGSAEAAEMVKLAETTYRDVNIGLANQFARFADKTGLDVYAVIEAANSQPFSHIHSPGIAVGGHCIPVYPRLYLWNDPEASVVTAARQANLSMPGYAVSLLEQSVGKLEGLNVLVWGAAYRGGVKETAFSGVFDVVKNLIAHNANVFVSDPLYSEAELKDMGFNPCFDSGAIDAIIVQTNHSEYSNFAHGEFPRLQVVIDGRNVISSNQSGLIKTIGRASGPTYE